MTRAEALGALAEGMTLGAYSYGDFKSEHKPNKLENVHVIGPGGRAVTEALEQGRRVAEAVCFVRDLVNEPGGSLTPIRFAELAEEMAERESLEITVLDLDAIHEAELGGLLGVNRGSEQPPRFVEVSYEPDPESECRGSVALVGKGITFDSGGLSIKTGTGMMTMKCDMSGGAAVLGVMAAIAAVAPPVKVTGYVPLTDNMLGGDATRPGDVLTMANGKTVEVLNTDAEGRLVLADALSLACRAEPDAIVDLATLTGACMVALGPKMAGLMGNNEAWIDQLADAAERTGERVWRPPAARRLQGPTRFVGGRHEEHRRSPRRSADRWAVLVQLRGGRHPLGPPRHRWPRLPPMPKTPKPPRAALASACECSSTPWSTSNRPRPRLAEPREHSIGASHDDHGEGGEEPLLGVEQIVDGLDRPGGGGESDHCGQDVQRHMAPGGGHLDSAEAAAGFC